MTLIIFNCGNPLFLDFPTAKVVLVTCRLMLEDLNTLLTCWENWDNEFRRDYEKIASQTRMTGFEKNTFLICSILIAF